MGSLPSGDADFIDMIEDIFKSGFAQAAIAAETSTQPQPAATQMERGLSSYQFPGTIQKKIDASSTVGLPPMQYDMPNAANNVLLAVVTAAGALTITSTNGETWTPLYSSGTGYQIWHAYAVGGPNTVTVSGSSGAWQMAVIEVGGTGGSIPIAALVEGTGYFVNNITGNGAAVGSPTTGTVSSFGVYPPVTAADRGTARVNWNGYIWPTLPVGAVVTGIKPVVVFSQSIPAWGSDGGVITDSTLTGWPQYTTAGTFVGGSFGTSPSDLTGWAPWIEINYSGDGLIYAANCNITHIAARIEYTVPTGGLGGDVVDAIVVTAGGPATVASSVPENLPGYLLAVSFYPSGSAPAVKAEGLWGAVTPENFAGISPATYQIQDRVIYSPGDYTSEGAGGTPASIALIALKAVQPPNYPRPLGDLIDMPTAEMTRAQCRAGGLWGSLTMNSQSAASDWLKTLCMAANCAPVFLGNKLQLIPYSEVSAVGNGAFYQAPTANGPVANLNASNGDFVGKDGCPHLSTCDRIGLPNVLQMQFIDRNANYSQTTAAVTDGASISLYGIRKADPITMNCVQDPTVARSLLGIQVRRNQYGGDAWAFSASARWSLLSPMDLVTLTDQLQDVIGVPVRITKYNEKDDGSFEGSAEPFVYGMCAPTALPTTGSTPNSNNTNASAGDVNPPIIFEPTPPLYPGLSGSQLWLVISE